MGDGILNRLRAGAVGLYRFAVPTRGLYFIGDHRALSTDFSYVITTSAPARASDSDGATQPTAGAGNQRLLTC